MSLASIRCWRLNSSSSWRETASLAEAGRDGPFPAARFIPKMTSHAAAKPVQARGQGQSHARHDVVSGAEGRARPATTPARMTSSFGEAA